MTISSQQRRRLHTLAAAIIDGLNEVNDGDATESLAALYAAAHVLERELIERGFLDPGHVQYIRDVGTRAGASMPVVVDEEILDGGD